MTTPIVWPEMDPSEKFPVTFPYAGELPPSVTLIAPIVVSVVLLEGVDPSPGSIIEGSPQIDGPNVLQTVKHPVHRCNYGLKCEATTSAGNVLVRSAILPGRNAV